MDRLTAMQVFVTVVEHGSFTAAAEGLLGLEGGGAGRARCSAGGGACVLHAVGLRTGSRATAE